jgi:AbrB family looped-hinge helix DNA binding protein
MTSRRATVSERGQVVIPKPIRDRLGIRPGETLEFAEEAGRLVARKVADRDPVAKVWGVLRLPRGVDDAIRELRGEPGAV